MFGFIPHNEAKQTIFTASGWQACTKPAGISHVAFTIIGAGGDGGDGAYGCGGGGGAAGTTQGAGGNGGNGLVIITCW